MFVILAPPPDLNNAVTGRVGKEELLRGNGARDLVEGLLLPLHDYRVNDFWGGSLALSILPMPFFLLLGPNIVPLRMSILFFACLCTASVFLILDRHVSRRAAWIRGLLLCFTPPGYTFFFRYILGGTGRNDPTEKILSFFQRDLADSFWFRDTLHVDGRLLGQHHKRLAIPNVRRPPGKRRNHEAYASTLLFLNGKVKEKYKPYFEKPVPGERFFNYSQRERFWRDYRNRKEEARRK